MSKEIPEKGKTYNCFDDGKISTSRLYTVDVVNVLPFGEADANTLDLWKTAKARCHWLFAGETDFFVFTENGEEGGAIFARTINGAWFSMGDFMNSGLLDVDGTLTESIT